MKQMNEITSTSADQVLLRPATPDDADVIHRMISELAQHLHAENVLESKPEDFRRHLSKDPVSFYGLLAEQNGNPVGLSLFFPSFSSWRGAQGVYIQDLYVAPECRTGGLGKRMLIEVLRIAHDQWGAKYLRLAVDETNMDGQGFYERLGMGWASKDRVFQIDGDDLTSLREQGEGQKREKKNG